MKLTLGQFGGMTEHDADEGDEKEDREKQPKFNSVSSVTIPFVDYMKDKGNFDTMPTPKDMSDKRPMGEIVLMGAELVKYYGEEESDKYSIMNNTYVEDYIHINHPSIREDWTSALVNRPLEIKPPPFFFSE